MKKVLFTLLTMCCSLVAWGDNIVFADANVKALCVANWDTNSDGELSVDEAAAVTYLGEVFKQNTTITSFDELQYFTGIQYLTQYAFDGCTNLCSVTIPNGTKGIQKWAFYGCSKLNTVSFPNSLIAIGEKAFYDCIKLTAINLPNNLESINDEAFSDCEGVLSLTIPESVESIGNKAFAGLKNVESLTIPDGVVSIGYGAFAGMEKLQSIHIPKSVTQIDYSYGQPFYYCKSLTTITVDADNPNYDSRNGCNAIIEKSTNTLVAGCVNTTIPSGITKIGHSAFYGAPIETITIPSSVTTIGNTAFSNCENLQSISIPSKVTKIESYAFSDCPQLESVTLSTGLKEIGQGAFSTLSNYLKSIVIPEGVTSIGSQAFGECFALESVSLPSTLTSYLSSTFYKCNNLTAVYAYMTSPNYINNQYTFPNCANATLYVPNDSKAAYQAANYWKDFKEVVGFGYIGTEDSELTGETGISCFRIVQPGTLGKFFVNAGKPRKVKIIGEVDYSDLRALFKGGYSYEMYSIDYVDLSLANIHAGSAYSYNSGSWQNYPDNYLDSDWMGGGSADSDDENWYGPRTIVLPMTLEEFKCATNDNYLKIYSEQTTPFKTTIDNHYGCECKFYVPSGTRRNWIEKTTYPDNVMFIDGPTKDVTVSSAGQLASLLTENEIETMNEITVRGNINAKDFTVLKRMNNLCKLTITATMEAYSGNEGPVVGKTNYEAGEIPARLFQNHQNLQAVRITGQAKISNSSYLYGLIIGDYAFDGCTSLTSFDGKVSSLGDFSFRNTNVGKITLCASNYVDDEYDEGSRPNRDFNHIGKNPFFGAKNAYYSRSDGNVLYMIPNYYIENLDYNRVFHTGVYSEDKSVLYTLTGIGFYCNILSSTTTLADYAISGIQNGTSIDLKNVTTIGDGFLYQCPRLQTITCDNTAFKSVDGVLYSANMKRLVKYPCAKTATSLTIPSTVEQISKWAFEGAQNLTTITVEATTPPALANLAFDDFDVTKITLYVPAGCKAAYEAADYWKEFKEIVEMPGVGSEFTAAVPCSSSTANLTFKVTSTSPLEVEVSASPEDIAGALTIPATVTDATSGLEFAVKSIGENTFEGRNELTAVTIEEGITKILGRSFTNCSALKSISIPEGVTTIMNNAFMNTGLESIKFPSTLTTVGYEAFKDCRSLKSIDFNSCSATFEYQCFMVCTSLEELYVPNTIKFTGFNHFWACSSLKTATFEPFEEGQEAWNVLGFFNGEYSTSALETVVLPSTSIMGSYFFQMCTSLKSVTFLKVEENYDILSKSFCKIFRRVSPAQIQFTVPEGSAETLLRAGYMNLSDKSGLPLVRTEFEAEASRIAAMADNLTDGDKTALSTAISNSRTIVNAAEDYATVYAQIAAIKNAAKEFLTTATLPAAFDVTAATITNPDISRFSIGWDIINDVSHVGYRENQYTNGDVTIDHFVEAWRPDGVLSNGTISQTITNLPAGVYRLDCDAIATWQDDASVEVTGLSLFAGNNSTAIATANEKPQHFSVKFEKATKGDITIGLSINNTTANWVAMDNVRLIYEGAVAATPAGAELVSSEDDTYYIYNVGTGMYLNGGNGWGVQAVLAETGLPVRMTQDTDGYWQVYFREGSRYQQLLYVYDNSGAIYTDFDNNGKMQWAITESDGSYTIQSFGDLGTNILLGNDPTRQDMDWRENKTLDTHIDVIRTDNPANNTRWQFIKKADYDLYMAKRYLLATIFRMELSDIDSDDLLNSAQAVYDNDAATMDEVIEATTLLNSQMGMPQLNQPVDMTALIVNPRFENNTPDGWTGARLSQEGNAQNTQYQTHEFYQTNFNMFQTITGVPNGLYRLKWKGFHRPGNRETVYAEYAAGTNNASAVVYANGVQKTMKHIMSEGSDRKLDNGTDTNAEYSYADGLYRPNYQSTSRYFFDAGFYADQLEMEVTDNVLTIGVKNTQDMGGEHWVIFSDFELEIIENAETYNNHLCISDVSSVPGGSATLPIKLENADQIVSFSAEVHLPAGIVPKTDDSGNIIVKKSSRVPMNVIGSVTADGTCRFAALTNGQAISGNSGEIFSFVILPAGNMELRDYEVRLDNIKLINDQLLRIQPFSAVSTLTLKEAASGDVNGDSDVDILDATMIVYYVLGRNPSLNLEAGDVNGDGDVDILDATIIVYRVLGRDTNPAAARQLTQPEPQ